MKKENVILDLDNTILSAEALQDFPFHQKGMREKALKFRLHDMDSYYLIFERPGTQDFLDWLFENYNVAVWTAATKDYALFIVDKIILKKSNRQLQFVMFARHCDISYKKYNTDKKLDLIFDSFRIEGFNRDNTIIIDDRKDVWKCQPDNAIHIKKFEILEDGSEHDDELTQLREEIKAKF